MYCRCCVSEKKINFSEMKDEVFELATNYTQVKSKTKPELILAKCIYTVYIDPLQDFLML